MLLVVDTCLVVCVPGAVDARVACVVRLPANEHTRAARRRAVDRRTPRRDACVDAREPGERGESLDPRADGRTAPVDAVRERVHAAVVSLRLTAQQEIEAAIEQARVLRL